MQIASSNPFSILSNKKIRHEPPKEKVKEKDTRPAQRKDPPKEGKKAEAKKEEPKKDAKVVSLTETVKPAEVQKQLAKEQEKLDKEAKRERDRTDKHDRSGKGHQVRKEGKGVGGWDDNKVDAEIAQEVVAEEADGEAKAESKKEQEKSAEELAAEAKAREEEAKLREMEEKQMTLEEWQEKQKKESAPPAAAFNVRTVDDSGFKGMVAKGKEKADKKFQIGASEKPKKAAPKKEEKKEEKKEKVQVELGFRTDNPARQGKGKGEGKGKGGGKGRGGYSAQPKEGNAPPVDDETAFPALGGASA